VEILRGRKWLDVNEKSGRYDGKTALSRAVSFRNLDLVRSLLKAGADPYADSPNAIDLATRYRFKDVEAVLRASTGGSWRGRRFLHRAAASTLGKSGREPVRLPGFASLLPADDTK
jgi:hypothetical protein